MFKRTFGPMALITLFAVSSANAAAITVPSIAQQLVDIRAAAAARYYALHPEQAPIVVAPTVPVPPASTAQKRNLRSSNGAAPAAAAGNGSESVAAPARPVKRSRHTVPTSSTGAGAGAGTDDEVTCIGHTADVSPAIRAYEATLAHDNAPMSAADAARAAALAEDEALARTLAASEDEALARADATSGWAGGAGAGIVAGLRAIFRR